LRPKSTASATTPAADTATEKSGAEKPIISPSKPTGDDSRPAVPNDSGEKKPALKVGQVDRSIKPAGQWISGSSPWTRAAGSL